jgi:hypothetical protein
MEVPGESSIPLLGRHPKEMKMQPNAKQPQVKQPNVYKTK